jgi:outer membrane protein assembly factor BamB
VITSAHLSAGYTSGDRVIEENHNQSSSVPSAFSAHRACTERGECAVRLCFSFVLRSALKPGFFSQIFISSNQIKFFSAGLCGLCGEIVLFLLALVAVSCATSSVLAEEPEALRLLWRTPLPPGGNPPVEIPASDGRRLFVVYTGIHAYSLETGKLLWELPFRSYAPRSLIADRNAVFVTEATVSALDGQTGRRLWEFTPDANTSLGRPALQGGILYFGTTSHRLYALRASDGRQLWVTDLGPAWKCPGVVRGIAVYGGRVYAALEQWRSDNGHISSGWLIALDAKTGKVRWRYETGAGPQRRGMSSSPLVTSGLVLAGDYLSNAVVAVNVHNGHEAWRFEGEPGFVGFPESPQVARGVVYAASGDTYVYALSLASGHLLWRTRMPAANEAQALCGKSLLVNHQGLAALAPDTGRITQTILHSEEEFPTSGFAVQGSRAFIVGPRAVYALACR